MVHGRWLVLFCGAHSLTAIAEFVKERGCGDVVIPMSVEFEQGVRSIDAIGVLGWACFTVLCFAAQIAAIESGGPDAVAKREAELGAKTCLPRIIKAGYRGLQLIHFFTAGEDEVKAWTIRVRQW
jgi:ribosome-binding ATPase YchF (GTP1/OBG family)